MWSDNDTTIDLIDYNHLVDVIRNIIKNDSLNPCTIGLYGDWGSGKSSLMNMTEDIINDDKDVITIKFNGWRFEGYEDARAVLMSTILEEIISKRTLTGKLKEKIIKLYKQIDKMKLLKLAAKGGIAVASLGLGGIGALGGLEIAKSLGEQDYEELFKKEEEKDPSKMSIKEFHIEFAELLSEIDIKRLVVFIDDLDRCTPDTVIATLEAIKLFLFTKNSAFIICADERIIEYSVRMRFPEIPGEERLVVGRDYLEKLIQFPIRIPQLSGAEIETYINLLFTRLYVDNEEEFQKLRKKVLDKKNTSLFGSIYTYQEAVKMLGENIPEELKEALILSQQITPILSVNLSGNPRQVKRFLNMMLMRMQMAKSKNVDIKKRILAKLMLLEYFKKESFRKLYVWQISQEGKPEELVKLEKLLASSTEKVIKDDPEIDLWVKDSWIKNWLLSEPALGGTDLRPYFYFSRDQLSITAIATQRMSELAKKILSNLLQGSETFKRQALKEAGTLSVGDASAIFDTLTQKIAQEGDKDERGNLFKVLFQWCGARMELLSQLITFLRELPFPSIPASVVTLFLKVVEGTQFETTKFDILKKWAENTENLQLAKIAAARLIKEKS